MRLRNVKGSEEVMRESPYVIQDVQSYRGHWNQIFENHNPIEAEVGMGKGKFITALAIQNPEKNYIGIEKYSSVLIRALEKRELVELSNLYFIQMDAEHITEVFGAGEIQRIYLNFSDPWPKERHAKRRLTSKEYFERYDQILSKDGTIEFKTDNQNLFRFSLESIKEAGWQLEMQTRDYHKSPYVEGNIMTEYEEKFSSMGNPICKLIAKR